MKAPAFLRITPLMATPQQVSTRVNQMLNWTLLPANFEALVKVADSSAQL